MDLFFVLNCQAGQHVTVSLLIQPEMEPGLLLPPSLMLICFAYTCSMIKTDLKYCTCSLLKIWNMNKCTGVVGVFNCQGAGWCKITKKTRIHDASPGTLSASVCAADAENLAQFAGSDWNGDVIVYTHRSG